MSAGDYSSVRDWRRKAPLRPRVTKKLDICWCWIKCPRCDHVRAVAIAPYIVRWGLDGRQDMLRRHGRSTACHVAMLAPGTSVKFDVVRNGESKSINVTLAEMPNDRQAKADTEQHGTPTGSVPA